LYARVYRSCMCDFLSVNGEILMRTNKYNL
jgi:hypothetical protein